MGPPLKGTVQEKCPVLEVAASQGLVMAQDLVRDPELGSLEFQALPWV